MVSPSTTGHPAASLARSLPFYYGWIVLGIAALAMVGTLPGRTQGLGLITEPLLADLHLDRVQFARMNLWATLLGSLFCLGIGRLLDHWGGRASLATVSLLLGLTTLAFSSTTTPTTLLLLLILTRGLGQSALSVVSLTLVGHWFGRRLHQAMGLYSVLLSAGFMAAFPLVGGTVLQLGWREAWAAIAWALLLGLVPLGLLLVRRSPEACGIPLEGQPAVDSVPAGARDHTWSEALRTPVFWVFALASSLYNLVASGIGLFNESILAERGFPAGVYHQSLVITALTSLAGNFLGGWLASRWTPGRLMALAMALLATSLATLPFLRTTAQVCAFAALMGIAGGFVIVLFFGFWAAAFGRTHLGRIQGTAQMLTVLASALGPLLLAQCHAWTGSYAAVFHLLAGTVLLLGIAAWRVRLPSEPN